MQKEKKILWQIGQKVTYNPGYKKPEKGIIKKIDWSNNAAWVVYNCAGNWNKYFDYTGAKTEFKNMSIGWI